MKFFRIPFNPDDESPSEGRSNRLQKYIQGQSVQDMSRMATEISSDVRQMIGSNVQALLGYLPASEFNTTVMASKESLQNLLASAMVTGYFMHAMETRMGMEELFAPEPAEPSLLSPEDLFPASAETVPNEEPLTQVPAEPPAEPSASPALEREGRFLSASELSAEQEREPLSIQLEINTRMDRAELAELLRELRHFQSHQREEPPQREPFRPEDIDPGVF
ncbi:MAG: DUF760 domain-containing protein [Candidatus Sericytochromatia bacterium]